MSLLRELPEPPFGVLAASQSRATSTPFIVSETDKDSSENAMERLPLVLLLACDCGLLGLSPATCFLAGVFRSRFFCEDFDGDEGGGRPLAGSLVDALLPPKPHMVTPSIPGRFLAAKGEGNCFMQHLHCRLVVRKDRPCTSGRTLYGCQLISNRQYLSILEYT